MKYSCDLWIWYVLDKNIALYTNESRLLRKQKLYLSTMLTFTGVEHGLVPAGSPLLTLGSQPPILSKNN